MFYGMQRFKTIVLKFKTTSDDLSKGELVKIWCFNQQSEEHYFLWGCVSRYYRPNVASSGCWLFVVDGRELSINLGRVEKLS